MPLATGASGYHRQERDLLGGWSAQGSERYTMLARRRISAMQVTVAKRLQDKMCADLLCEAEAHESLESFMREFGVPSAEVERTMKLLTSRDYTRTVKQIVEVVGATGADGPRRSAGRARVERSGGWKSQQEAEEQPSHTPVGREITDARGGPEASTQGDERLIGARILPVRDR